MSNKDCNTKGFAIPILTYPYPYSDNIMHAVRIRIANTLVSQSLLVHLINNTWDLGYTTAISINFNLNNPCSKILGPLWPNVLYFAVGLAHSRHFV